VGGNFFVLRMLDRYRNELGVTASPEELERAARRTVEHLGANAARVRVEGPRLVNGRVEADVVVENLAGHKLPTGYPSRRVWLHVAVIDRAGTRLFESGALRPDGSIVGHDGDLDGGAFEPHYREITSADQVQTYEAVMAGADGRVTTGLLTGIRYVKDNRVLPQGFDKRTAPADIAVAGDALADPGFVAGSDRIRYSMDVTRAGASAGGLRIEVRLMYQPIAFRWAQNLAGYDALETRRFLAYYRAMAGESAVVLARSVVELP
jgi:hypothetical protein